MIAVDKTQFELAEIAATVCDQVRQINHLLTMLASPFQVQY